ncbi:hypothetical protein GEMRC1_010377 [Eukaryota sp. GEM-RC1]
MPCSCLCHSKFAALHQTYTNLKAKAETFDSTIQKKDSELLQLRNENIELQRSIMRHQQEISSLKDHLVNTESLQKEITTLRNEISKTNTLKLELENMNLKVLQQERSSKRDAPLAQKLSQILSENTELRQTVNEQTKTIQKLEDSVHQLSKTKLELTSYNLSLQEEVARLQSKYNADVKYLSTEMDLVQDQHVKSRELVSKYKHDLREVERSLSPKYEPIDLESEILNLKEKIDSLQRSTVTHSPIKNSAKFSKGARVPKVSKSKKSSSVLDAFDEKLRSIQSSVLNSRRSVQNLNNFESSVQPYVDLDFDDFLSDLESPKYFSSPSRKSVKKRSKKSKKPWK